MSLGPVAASRADKAVVAPYIHNTVAETAEVLGLKYGHAYPSVDHGLVVEGIDIPVMCLGRDRVEPLTSAAGGGEVDVRLASEISTINERLPGVVVQATERDFCVGGSLKDKLCKQSGLSTRALKSCVARSKDPELASQVWFGSSWAQSSWHAAREAK